MSPKGPWLAITTFGLGWFFLSQDLLGGGWVLVTQLVGATALVASAALISRGWEVLDRVLLSVIAAAIGLLVALPFAFCIGGLIGIALLLLVAFGLPALAAVLWIKFP